MKGCSEDTESSRSLVTGLSSQFSMKNDQYPKTVIAALEVMKQHKHDDSNNHKKIKTSEKEKITKTITKKTMKKRVSQRNQSQALHKK